MSDVFVSYARPDEARAERIAGALRATGYQVWRDDELPAHRAYSDVIEERLKGAKAVVVLWSAEAARSQWVRAEADAARSAGTLVQVRIDGTIPPMPFNQIQCAELQDWDGDENAPGWRKMIFSVQQLARPKPDPAAKKSHPARQRTSVCVLPFANMSGDAEQEYFSDGISEDITTDLSKVSALEVIARNTAFTFKDKSVDVEEVARALGVTHVLEGSVRKAGGRVRINAQLIDGATGAHVWAERYDRDLDDIFAIQDELSKAIVDALKIKLLPEEKKALEHRGTSNVDAYNLYLMARQHWIGGTYGNIRKDQAIVRICTQAVSLAPDYAEAWALMALAQAELRFWHGTSDDGFPAAERALALNPNLPEPRCVKARYLEREGRLPEAHREIEIALELDPESWEVNREAARLAFREGQIREAAGFFERSMDLMNGDFHSGSMLITCYTSLGDRDALTRVSERTLERVNAAIAADPSNAAALVTGVDCLLILGDHERAREWSRKALLLDPDNVSLLYNLACCSAREEGDVDGAIELLEQFFEHLTSTTILKHLSVDPDLDPVRDHPRFKEMLAHAKLRLGVGD